MLSFSVPKQLRSIRLLHEKSSPPLLNIHFSVSTKNHRIETLERVIRSGTIRANALGPFRYARSPVQPVQTKGIVDLPLRVRLALSASRKLVDLPISHSLKSYLVLILYKGPSLGTLLRESRNLNGQHRIIYEVWCAITTIQSELCLDVEPELA